MRGGSGVLMCRKVPRLRKFPMMNEAARLQWLMSQIEMGNLVIMQNTAGVQKVWAQSEEEAVTKMDKAINVSASLQRMRRENPAAW